MRILVAEDDRSSRALLCGMLESWGHEPIPVSDGAQAHATLRADRALRMAILDWMMPGMEGPEVCRAIRREQGRPHLHMILVTAKGEREDIVAGIEAGADDYLVKPFDMGELRARVGAGERIIRLYEQLERANARLEELLSTDHLTGIMNRRAIVAALATELDRCGREGRAIGVAMIDLDLFKKINDAHGHAAGDAALVEAAARMKACCRTYDSIGRIGGDEFMAVLPGLPREAAREAGERLRQSVAGWRIAFDGEEIHATLSVGLAWLAAGADTGPDEIMRRADRALYDAKARGRDCVEVADAGVTLRQETE